MVDDMETFGGALEDVRAFCMVVELGTISAAARQLNETKGGISRRVTRVLRCWHARPERSPPPTKGPSSLPERAKH